MKVLLIHNYYGSGVPSGENRMFEVERDLLLRHGHQVESFTRHSDEIRGKGFWGRVKGGMATPWNPWMLHEVRNRVERFSPDVVHVHNSFPLVSPSVFYGIKDRALRVLTLHNYRLFCAAGTPFRDGQVCTECLDQKSARPGLRYGCYRDSRVATAPLTASIGLHRFLGTWHNEVDAFIALSDFQRQLMVDAGLPEKLVYVKPNCCRGLGETIPWRRRENRVVFVGRLSREKGLGTLLESWRRWGDGAPTLRIIGEGPLRPALERAAASLPVEFFGQLRPDETLRQIASAKLLVLPSEGYETFGLVVCEALAAGTPAAVSDAGPLPNLIDEDRAGVVFTSGNPNSLLESVRSVWSNQEDLARKSSFAHTLYEQKYTEDANFKRLMEIYRTALNRRHRRGTT